MVYSIIIITKEISEIKALDNSFKLSTGMRLTFGINAEDEPEGSLFWLLL